MLHGENLRHCGGADQGIIPPKPRRNTTWIQTKKPGIPRRNRKRTVPFAPAPRRWTASARAPVPAAPRGRNGKRRRTPPGSRVELELKEIHKKQLPVKIGEENNIGIETNAIYEYDAPVIKNTKIGNIVVKYNSKVVESVDIICSKEIEKKSIFSYLKELLSIIPNYEF